MSDDLEQISHSIVAGEVPAMWAANAFLSEKPLASWTVDLEARVKFFQTWAGGLVPAAFWLAGFFFPHGFLSGVLQNFARRHAVPINRVAFKYQVLDYIDPS